MIPCIAVAPDWAKTNPWFNFVTGPVRWAIEGIGRLASPSLLMEEVGFECHLFVLIISVLALENWHQPIIWWFYIWNEFAFDLERLGFVTFYCIWLLVLLLLWHYVLHKNINGKLCKGNPWMKPWLMWEGSIFIERRKQRRIRPYVQV